MSRVSTYLNFKVQAEEAFIFYRSIFGGEFGNPIRRFGEIPSSRESPTLSDKLKNGIMHIEL